MANAIEEQQDLLDIITQCIDNNDCKKIDQLLKDLHPAEIAHIIETLSGKEREKIWERVPTEYEGEILVNLNETVRSHFIKTMEPSALLAATESLETDDLADILSEIPQAVSQELLLSMQQQDRDRLKSVLSYAGDTAGGLMDLNTIIIRADTSLEVVLRYLRFKGELPEGTDTLYVVDRENKYLGLLPLTTLLTSDPNLLVADTMDSGVEAINANSSVRDVVNIFEHRDLITAPVIDNDNKLLGRITIDDVVDEIRDEAEHSVMSMAGLNEEDDMFAPALVSTKRRTIWLGVNLLTALLASIVISQFEATIEKLVALAILMPIVASMGGIAGSQTLTLVIRGMALGRIGKSNARRLLKKELWVGIFNGLIWAVIIAIVAGVWFNSLQISYIIGSAIIINLFVAALAGASIPLILSRMGIDPALAGTVILTTVTDVIGFLAFLGLATLVIL